MGASYQFARELRLAGIVPHTFPAESALKLGFLCANASRQGNVAVLSIFPNLGEALAKLGLGEQELLTSGKGDLERIKTALRYHGEQLPNWFMLGFWCFTVTWIFTATGLERELIVGRSINQEEVRDLFRLPGDARRAGSNFSDALMDIGWSPDDTEKFFLEKIVPFVWDEGHRRWALNIDMAVMQDLAFVARQADEPLRNYKRPRFYGALRELLEGVPVVGKAIATLAFGPKP